MKDTESTYVIQKKKGQYWAAAQLVEDTNQATKFSGSERQFVKLEPGEKWEKLNVQNP
jgi:hypothetical protein